MRAFVPVTGTEIFETINALAKAAHDDKARELCAPHRVDRWRSAVDDFYRKVEQVYLIEFLMIGVMRIERRTDKDFMVHAGVYEIGSLVICVGQRRVLIAPHLDPDGGPEGILVMQCDAHDREIELRCDLRGEDASWRVVAPDIGLRRLLRGALPPRTMGLDEHLFKAALNVVLLGPQPIFIFDGERFWETIGATRDRLLSLGIGPLLSALVARPLGRVRAEIIGRSRRLRASALARVAGAVAARPRLAKPAAPSLPPDRFATHRVLRIGGRPRSIQRG